MSKRKDAHRYRWIKQQHNFKLRTCPLQDSPAINSITKDKYYPSHYMNCNGRGFKDAESLDAMIDLAMYLFPLRPKKKRKKRKP